MKEFLRSFKYAFNGLIDFYRSERKAWIHTIAAIVVIFVGGINELNYGEWLWIILAIAMVFVAEVFNTAIEILVDHISKERSEMAKRVKDMSAAAVLLAAIGAAIIGIMVIGPHLH